ncbi:hypothetical protein [Actinoplanes sp. L3-i22]|uniref:hypothetical protein n=1 Tax=Actinoplanes sp. L3-i22 TaxID=2836373 RepID=UPI001C77969C|nr:hypothetical protein [Actinoplanes sp. L3-i22]BCY10984.1 hypothetical protein L3i22_060720 [Actinoplanes sp. L3-i22]
MDLDRVEHSGTLPDGRRAEIVMVVDETNYVEHEVLVLAVCDHAWSNPTYLYSTYRDGPGWEQLHTGLVGEPQDLVAAYQLWSAHHLDPLPLGYLALAALEGHLRDSQEPFAALLPAIPTDRLGAALDALMDLRMVGLRPDGYFGLTARAEAVLRPDSAQELQHFAAAITAAMHPGDAAMPLARHAFLPLPGSTVKPTSSGDMPPPPGPPRPASGR